MKMFRCVQLLLVSASIIGACSKPSGGNRQAPSSVPVDAPPKDARSKQAEALTEEAYDLKLEGRNQAALERLQKAHQLLAEVEGAGSEAAASNLDDQATIFLRTGDYPKARALYNQALDLLRKGASNEHRLASGIERRLATLKALERGGHHCKEPLVPPPDAAGPKEGAPLPYFPDKEALYEAYAGLVEALKPCLKKGEVLKPIPVWTVLLGTGEIVLSRTNGSLAGTDTARCIEATLIKASQKHAPKMPHFRACYRNFTYPFLIVP